MDLYNYTYDLVRQIPSGMVSSYGEVAKSLGDIRASRAVGRMMNQNPNADDMPCFKIVHSDGKLGGFGLGISDKINRLNSDNIQVLNGKIVDFDKVFFKDFKTDYPLKKLRNKQLDLSEKVEIKNSRKEINTVAGFDVAYPKNDFDNCCGAVVIIDVKTKKTLEEKIIHDKILFPYIPTYLSFRESNFIRDLYQKLELNPDLLMIDGNGILHPLGFGIASHVGVLLDVPSVGVAKSMLCGKLKNNTVMYDGREIGYAYYNSKRVKKPIFISPGHKLNLKNAVSIVKKLCISKIPEPIRRAHILAGDNI